MKKYDSPSKYTKLWRELESLGDKYHQSNQQLINQILRDRAARNEVVHHLKYNQLERIKFLIINNRVEQPHNINKKFAVLSSLTDYVPSRSIRKKQKKLIADESAEILEFASRGENLKVNWRLFWLRIHWFRYLVTPPLMAMLKFANKYKIK